MFPRTAARKLYRPTKFKFARTTSRSDVQYPSAPAREPRDAVVDAHQRARVVELAAIVRRAKERDELALREELVTVLYDLAYPSKNGFNVKQTAEPF